MKLSNQVIDRIIRIALDEDCAKHDITTHVLVDKAQKSEAYIISRQNAVLCGTALIQRIFKIFDPRVTVYPYHKDGNMIRHNEPIIFIKGSTRSILSCERVVLNFLAHLSGISTLTLQFVKAANNVKVQILDTRKTTPGLRDLEKYAVFCGGGSNHRHDLSDMILIKDNHLLSQKTQDFADIVKQVRRKTNKKVEIEVDTLNQFQKALASKPDIILLDNMNTAQIKKAVQIKKRNRSKVLLEASGGVNLKTIAHIAKTGVNRISIGQLTHSVPAVDFSMEFVK
ncbi:MAG: carboxylating nicotinate-nucleotide diphosphorylase [Candidatus Omnitrophica bacterium]|nr:carboxylating nicotinate-nucleotide diphosphorylase [Candidatus Omnitrophota bacterium]